MSNSVPLLNYPFKTCFSGLSVLLTTKINNSNINYKNEDYHLQNIFGEKRKSEFTHMKSKRIVCCGAYMGLL